MNIHMTNQMTELVFVLDKSGSMSGLETDTIGGFNAMLRKQKALTDPCRITTVLFDHRYTLLHDRIDIQAVQELTTRDYEVGGMTALLDALGRTMDKIEQVERSTSVENRPSRVIFVIITDGEENASRLYSAQEIQRRIRETTKREHWEFIFLAANLDAVAEAAKYGISPDRAANYRSDKQGTRRNYEVVSEVLRGVREQGCVPVDWKAKLDVRDVD